MNRICHYRTEPTDVQKPIKIIKAINSLMHTKAAKPRFHLGECRLAGNSAYTSCDPTSSRPPVGENGEGSFRGCYPSSSGWLRFEPYLINKVGDGPVQGREVSYASLVHE